MYIVLAAHNMLLFQMNTMNRIFKLFTEVRSELLLISWPSRKEVLISLGVVCIAVMISSIFFFAADYFLYKAVQFFIKS